MSTTLKKNFKLWIDADACPRVIKEFIFQLSAKKQFEVVLVANSSMFIPSSPLIKLVQVKIGPDMADHYIVQHTEPNDIVVTADIPLAAFIVEKGATAINIRGETYTEDNVREHLSFRDFMKELRDSTGLEIGGPPPFGPKDKERFANALTRLLDKKL